MRIDTVARRLAIFAAVSLSIAHSSDGRAQPMPGSTSSGVVAIGGNATESERSAIGRGIDAATRAAGWELASAAPSKKERRSLLRCLAPGEPDACIPASLGMRGIRYALVVAANQQALEDGSPMVVLIAKLIVTQPKALVVRQRFCERCSDDQLTQAAVELAQQVMAELAVRGGRTILEVRSIPTGARIVLDGEPIGATDASFNTYPGGHVVIVEKPGFITQTLPIEAREGVTAQVSAMLRSSASSPSNRPRPAIFQSPSLAIPMALIGTGSGLLVVSAAFAVVGARDGENDRYRYSHASEFGVATGVVAALTLCTGFYLWRHKRPTSTPTVNVAPGVASVEWTGSF